MLVKRWNTLIFYAGVHMVESWWQISKNRKGFLQCVCFSPSLTGCRVQLVDWTFPIIKRDQIKILTLNFMSLISHCHKQMKKKVYLEGGWYFKTFCRTSLETLGSLQAVKQFRCSSWQCVCKRYFIIALQLEVEMVPLTHRGWLPLQVPFFWHVLFESPLRIYVLLQKYSTYFILPSEPETSV